MSFCLNCFILTATIFVLCLTLTCMKYFCNVTEMGPWGPTKGNAQLTR